MKKILTLCTILKDGKILSGMKKRGFGAGRWNGFGGKLHDGETIEEALARETKEEAGVEIKNPEKAGIIEFEFKGDSEILEVHIYKTGDFEGEPVETEEMKPQWFDFDKIPYDLMWPDDKFWLPLLLEGKKFKGKFLFSGDNSNPNIIKYNLEIAESL